MWPASYVGFDTSTNDFNSRSIERDFIAAVNVKR